MSGEVKSKGGAPIEEGDTVFTKIRGGKHEGQVEKVITDAEEARTTLADAKGAKGAPAVLFHDQNDRKVAHKPGTLNDLDKE